MPNCGAVPNHKAGSGPERDCDLKHTLSSMHPHSRPSLFREQEMQRQQNPAANLAYNTGKKIGNANPHDAKDNSPVSRLPQSHNAPIHAEPITDTNMKAAYVEA